MIRAIALLTPAVCAAVRGELLARREDYRKLHDNFASDAARLEREALTRSQDADAALVIIVEIDRLLKETETHDENQAAAH